MGNFFANIVKARGSQLSLYSDADNVKDEFIKDKRYANGEILNRHIENLSRLVRNNKIVAN